MAPGTEKSQTKAVIEALESDDPAVIKTIRKSQLGMLTRSKTNLQATLVFQEGSSTLYDLERINIQDVAHIYSQAEKTYENVVNLHERYLLKKVDVSDTEAICDLYISNVENSFREVVRLRGIYQDQLKA